mgnify:CR=1 FL=1
MADEKKKAKSSETSPQGELVIALPDKRVPKICTSITFGKMGKNIVLTMFYEEKPSFPEKIVIERVILDQALAKQTSEILNKLISEEE